MGLNYIRSVIRFHIEAPLLRLTLRRTSSEETELWGNNWLVPHKLVKKSCGKVSYCAGVGEDLALENDLSEFLHVIALDPTPRSKAFVASNPEGILDRKLFSFKPFGLWKEDVELEFVAPDDPEHVSYSIKDNTDGRNSFLAQCYTVKTCMEKFGHTELFLLKMNIEGAEYDVLSNLTKDQIDPTIIMLTYEGDWAFFRAHLWTHKLKKRGYKVAGIKSWAVTYVCE